MEVVFILVALPLILDVIAVRWGFDSRESFNSSEWEKRGEWNAFH